MKRILIYILVLGLGVSACEYKDMPIQCLQGKVIMSSCCTGSTFIDLDSSVPIGKPTQINGTNYRNVIQVPGSINNGNVYLSLRQFDPKNDQSLFPIHCMCFIAIGTEVPVWVATNYSYTSCNELRAD